jgi:transcriptional regulator with PAS, ATPase and Fis domain
MSRTSTPNVSTASKSTLRDQIPDEAQLPPSEPKLHVLSSPDKKLVGQSIGLRVADAFLLGRGVDRDGLNVADPKMSRLHARIVWDGRSSMSRLDDADSANGCFVDGERRASTTLRHGTVIRLGDTVFVFAESDPMASVHERARRAAEADVAVLIIGPTGTGKEVLAQQIHAQSQRKGDFIAVNCASLSENLVGSELFGHTRGAFSGAGVERPGLFRAAHRGTLLLDEIGDLPMSLQPALLRALQERAVRPIGAEREIPVDVRIIAATHQDLRLAMDQNRFRRDLFARLAQVELRLAPLSERTHELRSLVASISERLGLTVKVSPDAMEAMALWPWPHNVRELENLLHKLRVFAGATGELDKAFLEREAPEMLERIKLSRASQSAPPQQQSKRPSREELAQVLARHSGNVVLAAAEFGTSRTQVYRWLKRYGIGTPSAKR